MRLVSALAAVVVVILGLVWFVILSGVPKLSDCLKAGNDQLAISEKTAAGGHWNYGQVCAEDKRVILVVSACYQKTGENSIVPAAYVEAVAQFMKPGSFSLKQITENHNKDCASYSATLI